MKKLFYLFLILSMVLASASVAFGELTSYTKSPSKQETPEIEDIEIIDDEGKEIEIVEGVDIEKIEIISADENSPKIVVVKNEGGVIQFYTKDGDGPAVDDCIVSLKVTPYAEKKTIEEIVCKVTDGTSATGEVSAEERLEYARTNKNNGTDGLGKTNFRLWRDIINEAAKDNLSGAKDASARIKNKDIVIATIFDVSVWCEKPAQHDLSKHHCVHTIRLTFGDDNMSSLLNNYVALMHFNRAGEWEYIPSKLYEDPKTKEDIVEFAIDCDNLSPFAIAAYSSQTGEGAPTSPQTGDTFPTLYAFAAIVSLGFAGFFFVRGRKRNN